MAYAHWLGPIEAHVEDIAQCWQWTFKILREDFGVLNERPSYSKFFYCLTMGMLYKGKALRKGHNIIQIHNSVIVELTVFHRIFLTFKLMGFMTGSNWGESEGRA